MKRSEINAAIRKAKKRLAEYKISLPMFGHWTCEIWAKNIDKISRIKERMLGWDVTDFGSGDFSRCGAVLFTVRNGDKNDPEARAPYAEKYIILSDETQQEIPLHYHIEKTEDIINRGGGILMVQLYHKTEDGELDQNRPVEVWMDAVRQEVPAGGIVEVMPGNSITLEPYVYHRFYARRDAGLLIVGEVSKVNDDNCDNVFYRPSDRFCGIEEDEATIHPLVNEYEKVVDGC